MKSSGEFEQALLKRMVQALQPDFAAVVCGPGDSIVFAADPGQRSRNPNPSVVGKVLESGEPASESTPEKGTLAVPYLDSNNSVQGVMYIEVNPPRRLKNIDLAILQRLREKVEQRHKGKSDTPKDGQTVESAQKAASATLDIVLRVLKPPRASIFAWVEGQLKPLAAQEMGGESFAPAISIEPALIESLLRQGRSTFLTDAQSDVEWESLGLTSPPGQSRSAACCMLRDEAKRPRGLVFLDCVENPGLFDGSELLILERLAGSLEKEISWLLNNHDDIDDVSAAITSDDSQEVATPEPEADSEPEPESEPETKRDSEPESEPSQPQPSAPVISPGPSPDEDYFDYPDEDLENLLDVVGEFFSKTDDQKQSQEAQPIDFPGFPRDLPYKPGPGESLSFTDIALSDPQSLFPGEPDGSETFSDTGDSDVVTLERENEPEPEPESAPEPEPEPEEHSELQYVDPVQETTEDILPPVDIDPEMLERDRKKLAQTTTDSTIEVSLEAAMALRQAMQSGDDPPESDISLPGDPAPTPDELVASLTVADLEPDDSLTFTADDSAEAAEDPSDESQPTFLPDEPVLASIEDLPFVADEEISSIDQLDFEPDDPLANIGQEMKEPVQPVEGDSEAEADPPADSQKEEEAEPISQAESEPSEEPADEPQDTPIEVTDSAEALFESPEVPQTISELSSKLDELKDAEPEPDVLNNLLESKSPLKEKKKLPDDDILRSLLATPDESEDQNKADSETADTVASESDNGESPPLPSIEQPSPIASSSNRTESQPKHSFLKRAWKFFWPFGANDGTYLTPVTISGEVLVDSAGAQNDKPIEVILFFPASRMKVVLQLEGRETHYFFSGNFTGQDPPEVSIRVQKDGYFPAKISRIKLFESEDGFKAELNPIELLSQ